MSLDLIHTLRPLRILRYGENPHQVPARHLIDLNASEHPLALHNFKIIDGDPGFINLKDLNRMIYTASRVMAVMMRNFEFRPFIALACKHGNSVGLGTHGEAVNTLRTMINGNKTAIFGGEILLTFPVTEAVAKLLLHYGMSVSDREKASGRRILDLIAAPSFDDAAIELLKRKEGRCKMIANPFLLQLAPLGLDEPPRLDQVLGGFLEQPPALYVPNWRDDSITIHGPLSEVDKVELSLAWAVGSTSNSNTITLVRNRLSIGNGVGQMDRVGAADLALYYARRSEHMTQGAVAYSDSFFPQTDGPATLADAGIKAIFATSGSINDEKVIDYCKSRDVTLCMISDKIARGFAWH